MRKPTIEEVRAAAASGAGSMETVRAANAYLRLRFGWACDERDALRAMLRTVVGSYSEAAGDREGSTCLFVAPDVIEAARRLAGEP